MPMLELAPRPIQRNQAARLEGREITHAEDNSRAALIVQRAQMLGEGVVAGRERALGNLPLHPLLRLSVRPRRFALDAGTHEVLLEDLFESHSHAFRVAHNFNHSTSLTSGAAGENSSAAAATL